MDAFQVRLTEKAQSDLNRLYEFLLEFDIHTAERALQAIENDLDFLRKSSFSCRKGADGAHGSLLRELIISFGATGYLALFEIEDAQTVSVRCAGAVGPDRQRARALPALRHTPLCPHHPRLPAGHRRQRDPTVMACAHAQRSMAPMA